MIRKARAVWRGTGRAGKGELSSDSGVLSATPYSFKTRFESEKGTNPEELIAAAHAGCFTMALSAALSGAGLTATSLTTEASLTLEQVEGNWTITTINLVLTGVVPGTTPEKFQEIAAGAKANCPISRVLNAKITLEAKLAS